jgi:glutamate N-acetyltransferase/amino-acid N-acetyltransferase
MDFRASDFQCPNFRAAGVASGIKGDEALDLALIISDNPTKSAAVFTKNRVKAAPVILAMSRLDENSPRAVLINSGNANACTGKDGISDAEATTSKTAEILGILAGEVIPASTGVIGARLPVGKITASMKALCSVLAPDGFLDAAKAIMTTDTFPKLAKRRFQSGGKEYTLLGIAKGAGMICPDMATMLAIAVTDIPIKGAFLKSSLKDAVDSSFNAITIDGDMSTNDMVLLLSSPDRNESKGEIDSKGETFFSENLKDLLGELAEMIVRDGEGATKFVRITVKGAPDRDLAKGTALKVANSPLVKTAFFGEDPNWGRIMAKVGCIDGNFDPQIVDISIDNILLVSNGQSTSNSNEETAKELMGRPEFTIHIDLKAGKSSFTVLTSDLSLDYVRINAEYRS